MRCLFCNSENNKQSFLPSTFYNDKRFDYIKCNDCLLLFIHPRPNDEDLIRMYPPSYQGGVNRKILDNLSKKLDGLRFSYKSHFDLLESIGFDGTIIDFGCGSANFIVNAIKYGYLCDGAEYNPKHVEILKRELPERNFFTVDEFLNSSTVQYDVIRLSNVFEHFTDPKQMLADLKKKLKPNGYLLLEGPIETNFNLALQFRKLYFKTRMVLQPNRRVEHTPTHIIFTNRKNQLEIFKQFGFKTIEFKVQESAWPFPTKFSNANGIVQKLNVIIARISIAFSKVMPKWGNTFLYLGQKVD